MTHINVCACLLMYVYVRVLVRAHVYVHLHVRVHVYPLRSHCLKYTNMHAVIISPSVTQKHPKRFYNNRSYQNHRWVIRWRQQLTTAKRLRNSCELLMVPAKNVTFMDCCVLTGRYSRGDTNGENVYAAHASTNINVFLWLSCLTF